MAATIWTRLVERDEDFTEGRFRDGKAIMNLKLTAGRPLKAVFPQVVVEVTSDHPPADYFEVGPMRVVSDKLRQVLETEVPSNHFELLPIKVAYRGEEVTDSEFYCFNVLYRVAAIDRDASDVDVDEEDYVSEIRHLVLDAGQAEAQKLFELDACWVPVLCARSDLATAIETAGCRGMRFLAPRDVPWPTV